MSRYAAGSVLAVAEINRDGVEGSERLRLELNADRDAYRWYGENDCDTEVSGRTVEAAIEAARSSWSAPGWDFRVVA